LVGEVEALSRTLPTAIHPASDRGWWWLRVLAGRGLNRGVLNVWCPAWLILFALHKMFATALLVGLDG